MAIPLCDPQRQYLELREEIDAAILAAAAAGQYILGPQVHALEREVAAYCDCEFAVGVGSGTDALHLALRGLRIGPGDEVITTPFTFVATTEAIGMVGATPVFVDIDPATYNLDHRRLEAAITPHTKAVIPVHLYGHPCEMAAILEIADRYGLHVIEDAAQSFGGEYGGRKLGSLGQAGCFSFFPSKNLGCLGDGGMLITNDQQLYERVEMLRRHGGQVKYHHSELGLNSRLDEIQAAVLRVKLRTLDRWNHERRALAHTYRQLLASTPVRLPPGAGAPSDASSPAAGSHSVFHQYTIGVDGRDEVAEQLHAAGVASAVYYPIPLHLQAVHRDLGGRPGDFPFAEAAARDCLSLPMFPGLSQDEQHHVVRALGAAVAGVAECAAA